MPSAIPASSTWPALLGDPDQFAPLAGLEGQVLVAVFIASFSLGAADVEPDLPRRLRAASWNRGVARGFDSAASPFLAAGAPAVGVETLLRLDVFAVGPASEGRLTAQPAMRGRAIDERLGVGHVQLVFASGRGPGQRRNRLWPRRSHPPCRDQLLAGSAALAPVSESVSALAPLPLSTAVVVASPPPIFAAIRAAEGDHGNDDRDRGEHAGGDEEWMPPAAPGCRWLGREAIGGRRRFRRTRGFGRRLGLRRARLPRRRRAGRHGPLRDRDRGAAERRQRRRGRGRRRRDSDPRAASTSP